MAKPPIVGIIYGDDHLIVQRQNGVEESPVHRTNPQTSRSR